MPVLLNKIESDHRQLPYRYHDLPFVCHDRSQLPKALLCWGRFSKATSSGTRCTTSV